MNEKAGHCGSIDLSDVDVRVRCVLRKLRVDTVEKLLAVTAEELSALKNCGDKTIVRIMTLQAKHKQKEKWLTQSCDEKSRIYMNRLIAVAIAANEVIAGAEKSRHSRYYFRVPVKRFNVLRRSLETLKGD